MAPRVSVLVINYNYSAYIEEAVTSVLRQDLPASEFEVIVIDDGSTDDSFERIKPFLDKVRWITKPRGGQVSAFNAGFNEARGDYVALLESDDTWEPSKLRRCLDRLEREPQPALVQHWLIQSDVKNRPLTGYEYPPHPDHFGLYETMHGTISFAGTSCIVFRASRLRPYLPLPENLLFGADICLRLIAATLGPIANIPEGLGKRRLHGRNLFGETLYDDPEKLERALVFHDSMIEYQHSHLTVMGMHLDPVLLKRLQMDRILMQFFLCRYRWNFFGALGAAVRLVRLSGLHFYTLFKTLTLFVAFISPTFYLFAHKIYSRNASARRLRAILFPV